eukprot:14887937-Alexandrium_andersonii.AAC.1
MLPVASGQAQLRGRARPDTPASPQVPLEGHHLSRDEEPWLLGSLPGLGTGHPAAPLGRAPPLAHSRRPPE